PSHSSLTFCSPEPPVFIIHHPAYFLQIKTLKLLVPCVRPEFIATFPCMLFCDVPLMWMERAATSLFGVKRYGVHINGYTVSDSGEIHLWLARRSITKQTYPGLLDNMVAGGLAAGVGIKYTLIKECEEEACIPADITMKAHPVSTVSYTYEDEEGVFPESQFVFDLELPLDFMPCIGDGEVQEFYMLSIEKVKDLLATDDFKPNSAMVVLDFLIRHSFIEPDTEPYYQEFVMGLHQRL
uniref:Thiamin pyrophosphokinase 2 n=1 Tax=Fundulus heteroclitus TaxID=8078 RepID=A0A3Q2PFZ8_FUNHE